HWNNAHLCPVIPTIGNQGKTPGSLQDLVLPFELPSHWHKTPLLISRSVLVVLDCLAIAIGDPKIAVGIDNLKGPILHVDQFPLLTGIASGHLYTQWCTRRC